MVPEIGSQPDENPRSVIRLTKGNLPLVAERIAELGVPMTLPGYSRPDVTEGVMAIGCGNFTAGHVAAYFDDALHHDPSWGVCAVSLRTPEMVDAIESQGGLYVLREEYCGKITYRVLGSIKSALYAPRNPETVLRKLDRVKLVTLTITRDGYCVDTSGKLDRTNPDVTHDLANPRSPKTAIGLLVEGLRRRYHSGSEPFVVVSCDNLPQNGDVIRNAALEFANHHDTGLATWIAEKVAFCSSMVDRIVPGRRPGTIDTILQWGIETLLALSTEPKRYFVIEAPNEETKALLEPLSKAGVKVVGPGEAQEYWESKLLLLNGSHFIIALVNALIGLKYVHDGANHDGIASLVQNRALEVIPILGTKGGLDYEKYVRKVLARFRNFSILDPTSRVGRDTIRKIRGYVINVIAKSLKSGESCAASVKVLALWVFYLSLPDVMKIVFESDPGAKELKPLAETLLTAAKMGQRESVSAALKSRPDLFGDLGQNEEFVQTFSTFLMIVQGDEGVEALLGATIH